MEAKQVSHEFCEAGHSCQAHEELQASSSVVVPHPSSRKHNFLTVDVIHLERGCAAAMVGHALCFRIGLAGYSSYWSHPSNHKSGGALVLID